MPDADIDALLAREEIPAIVEFIQGIFDGPDWEGAIDADMSEENKALVRNQFDAYARGDIRWLLEHTAADVTISQPQERIDGRSFRGRAGLVEALHDWPSQWEELRLEPIRVLEDGPGRVLIVHREVGRGASSGIEVGGDFVFAFAYRDGLLTRWDMFLTLENALAAGRPGAA